jgi:hypothetical protein
MPRRALFAVSSGFGNWEGVGEAVRGAVIFFGERRISGEIALQGVIRRSISEYDEVN